MSICVSWCERKPIAVGKVSDNEISIAAGRTYANPERAVWRAQIGLIVIHYAKLNFNTCSFGLSTFSRCKKTAQKTKDSEELVYQNIIGGRVLFHRFVNCLGCFEFRTTFRNITVDVISRSEHFTCDQQIFGQFSTASIITKIVSHTENKQKIATNGYTSRAQHSKCREANTFW